MSNQSIEQKLSEIIRQCRKNHELVDHIRRFLERLNPDQIDMPGKSDRDPDGKRDLQGVALDTRTGQNAAQQKKPNRFEQFWKNLPPAERIQGTIGILFFLTLLYSVRSYDLSRDTRDKQLRAYVVVTSIQVLTSKTANQQIGLQPGTNIFRFIQKNTGQTPAKYLQLTLDPEPWLTGGLNTSIKGPSSPATSGVLGPGDMTWNDEVLSSLSQPAIDDLNRDVAHVQIKGTITYQDVFGKNHHTLFCFFWAGVINGMQPCLQGNDFD
jgi:hypothetical protein